MDGMVGAEFTNEYLRWPLGSLESSIVTQNGINSTYLIKHQGSLHVVDVYYADTESPFLLTPCNVGSIWFIRLDL